MPTPGRNDPCPCGSGKKYKRCCLDTDQAAALAPLIARRAEQEAAAAKWQAQRREHAENLWATMDEAEELDDASNAVVTLIEAGRLDEAEHAARALLVNYPEVHDGHDRLGMVYEARNLPREAADSYRQILAFIRAHPEHYELEMETFYLERIARLDPPAAG
jgi:tetratricopeptide (TPR) repeat protein